MEENKNTRAVPPVNNPEALREAIEDSIRENLKDLLEATEDNLREFSSDVSRHLSRAIASGRQDLVDRLINQTQLLAELNRVQAVNESWDTVQRIIRVVATFGVRLVAMTSV